MIGQAFVLWVLGDALVDRYRVARLRLWVRRMRRRGVAEVGVGDLPRAVKELRLSVLWREGLTLRIVPKEAG